jgi:hypothetical protein
MGMNLLEGSSIQILIVLSKNARDPVLDFISHASNCASTIKAG